MGKRKIIWSRKPIENFFKFLNAMPKEISVKQILLIARINSGIKYIYWSNSLKLE